MRIEEVDARDAAAFAQWYAAVDGSMQLDRPGERVRPPGEWRAVAVAGRRDASSRPQDELHELLVARAGDEVVGAAQLELPLVDNRHVAGVGVWVRPDARRRGVGSGLLAELVRRAGQAGRGTLWAEVDEPPALASTSPGRAFAHARGFDLALVEERRDLALPVDPAHLDALDAACRPHAQGYEVRTWRDRCPDDLLESRAALGVAMSTDAPLGELDWREEAWDADRVRRRERDGAEQGRTHLAAGAVHAGSGRLVAFTEVAVAHEAPELVRQWETLVAQPHRGHRLGTLVKTAVLRRLADELPEARTVITVNAGTNAPMVAINETLGFRPNGELLDLQRVL